MMADELTVGEQVRQLVAQLSFPARCPAEIPLDGDLADLGIDSISFVELIVALEQRFGIEINDELLTLEHLSSVSALIEVIQTSPNPARTAGGSQASPSL